MAYRKDVQGLRAIAVCLVLFCHARVPGFSGGFVGVDVFFVISGYLITGLILSERVQTGSFRYGAFLARRLKRLFPALLLMLLIVQIASWFLLSSYEAYMQTGSLIYAATWTSNFYFYLSEFNYFAALQSKDLFLHTWSLGVEEQFYLIWPLVVLLPFFLYRRSAEYSDAYVLFKLILLGIAAVSFTVCIFLSFEAPFASFYMMPSRCWQFAIGACVLLASKRFVRAPWQTDPLSWQSRIQRLLPPAGLLMIVVSTVLFDSATAYPSFSAMLPTMGAALLLLPATDGKSSHISSLLSSPGLVWLGDRSYSIYLWHWPLVVLGGAYGLTNNIWSLVCLMGLCLALSMCSYSWVEKPVWKGSFSKIPARTVAFSWAFAVVLITASSHVLIADIFTKIPSSYYEYETSARANEQALIYSGPECDTWHTSANVEPCEFGNREAEHTVVVLGDSVGARITSLLPAIYSSDKWRILVYTKSACAIADLDYYYSPVRGNYDICTQWREAAINEIAQLEPDAIYMGSSAYYDFDESQWIRGVRSVVDKLSPVTETLIILPGTPALSFDGPSCVRQPYRFTLRLADSERICEEKMASTVSLDVADYMYTVANEFNNAFLLNLNESVCPEGRCAARSENGIDVYSDNVHLAPAFIHSLAPIVSSWLKVNGIGPQSQVGEASSDQDTASTFSSE